MRNIPRSLRHGAKQATSFPSIVIDKIRDRVSVRLSTNGAVYRNLKLVGGPVQIGQLVYTDFTTPEPTVVAPGIDYSQAFEEIERRIEEPLPAPPQPPAPVYEQDMIEVWLEDQWYLDSNNDVVKILPCFGYYPVTPTGLQTAIEACPPFGLISIPETPDGITGDFDFWYYQSIVGKGRDKTFIYGQTRFRNGTFIQDLTIDHDPTSLGPGYFAVGMVLYGDLFMRDINLLCYNRGPSSGSGIGITSTELSTTWVADGCYIRADQGIVGNVSGAGEGIDYIAQGVMGWTSSGFDLPERGYGVFCDHAQSKHVLHWYGKYFEMTEDIWQLDVAGLVLKSTLYESGIASHLTQNYSQIDMWFSISGSSAQQLVDEGLFGSLSSASNGSDFGEKNMYRSGYGKQMQRGDCEGHYIQDQSFWHFYLNGLADQMWFSGIIPGVMGGPTAGSDYVPQIPFQARAFWDEKDAANPDAQDGGVDGDNYDIGDMIHFSFDTDETEKYYDEDLDRTFECQEAGVGSVEFDGYTPDGGYASQSSGSSYPAGQVPRYYCDWRYKSQPEYAYFWISRAGGLRGLTEYGEDSGSCYTAGEYAPDYPFNDRRLSNRLYASVMEPKYIWMTRPNGKKVWYLPTLFNGRMRNCTFQSSWIDIDARIYSFVVVDEYTFGSLYTVLGTVVKENDLTKPIFSLDAPSDPFPYQMWFPSPY
jgi:hypothetical protein